MLTIPSQDTCLVLFATTQSIIIINLRARRVNTVHLSILVQYQYFSSHWPGTIILSSSMKRTYSLTGRPRSETPDIEIDGLDVPSEHGTVKRIQSACNVLTPPQSPESPDGSERPSKLRRHGSKLLSALKSSFRNSGKSSRIRLISGFY